MFPDLHDVMKLEQRKPVRPGPGDELRARDEGGDVNGSTASGSKAKPTNILDPKRSQDVCIVLAQFGRMSLEDIVQVQPLLGKQCA